jgi:hypothetical protein
MSNWTPLMSDENATYLRDILAKIAEGHTINRIDELVPWRMIPEATASPP